MPRDGRRAWTGRLSPLRPAQRTLTIPLSIERLFRQEEAQNVPTATEPDRLLNTREAAERLACSPALVRRFGARGVLPRVKLGRLTRYRASDVGRLVTGGARSGSLAA
jgi:hypothetical protein